jgi:hypothetical protein
MTTREQLYWACELAISSAFLNSAENRWEKHEIADL